MPRPAYLVKTPTSHMVMTVSRCMKALAFGMFSATIFLAEPALKRLRARSSTACGVVRSLMPIRTAPRPMTSTSPPSIVAGSATLPGIQML